MFKSKKFETVELLVPATTIGFNQQIYFQNQPQLQSISGDKRIYVKKIEAYTVDTLIASPKSTGNAMATAADIVNGTLVLSIQGENAVNLIPLSDLCENVAPGSFTPWKYNGFLLRNQYKIDWTKSYVQCPTPPVAVPFTYVFGVHYDYEPDYDDLTKDELTEFLTYATAIPNYPLSVVNPM